MFFNIIAVVYSPFWDHVIEYKKLESLPNLLINSYEEMKKVICYIDEFNCGFISTFTVLLFLSINIVRDLVNHYPFSKDASVFFQPRPGESDFEIKMYLQAFILYISFIEKK